jgi:hypothetical protein
VVGLAFVATASWLLFGGGPLSLRDRIEFTAGDLVALVVLPVALFRWRLVLERDELAFVFLRVRRVALRDIVEAKCVAGRGLVFVRGDGSDESTQLVSNSAWGHRRKRPTRADLIARTVLCAAAESRGEAPPVDYRLPPLSGLRRASIRGFIAAILIGTFLSD